MVLACAAVAQDTVQLRTSVTLAPHATRITLGDIAQIEGTQAALLRDVVVLDHVSATPQHAAISLEAVRAALESAPGVNRGRVALSGSGVRVLRAPDPVAASAPVPAPSLEVSSVPTSTVRTAIAPRIAAALGMPAADLRLTFDEDDASLLDTSVAGRVVSISPTASGDRVPLHIRVYEGDRVVVARSTRVGVLVRRQVAVATRALQRDAQLDPTCFELAEQWLPPSIVPAPLDGLAGKALRASVRAGQPIEARHVEEPVVVRKGERVAVDCLHGSIVVRSMMRANGSGKVGDIVELLPLAPGESAQSRDGVRTAARRTSVRSSPLFGRIAGPGRVVVASDSAEPSPGASQPPAHADVDVSPESTTSPAEPAQVATTRNDP